MKRTDKLAISQVVKAAVARRDSVNEWPCCILCGRPAPTDAPHSFSCAHYIARSQGGLGIQENILTLCPDCHRKYDQTAQRSQLQLLLAKYLRKHYADWDENRLVYRKD